MVAPARVAAAPASPPWTAAMMPCTAPSWPKLCRVRHVVGMLCKGEEDIPGFSEGPKESDND